MPSDNDHETTELPVVMASAVPSVDSGNGNSLLWWLIGIGVVWFLLARRRGKQGAVSDRPGTIFASDQGEGVTQRRPAPARQGSPRSSKDGTRFWVSAGKTAEVAGLPIGSMVYVGRGLVRRDAYGPENCLIDPSLSVARRNPDHAGRHMPYWPSYSEIAPTSRLAYLQWLASGRDEPDAYIGYVFLYFYGLERRLFLDNPPEDEKRAIFAEAERLRGIYGQNGSFRRYSASLLECAPLLLENTPLEAVFERHWEVPLTVKLAIGRALKDGNPLSADWALSWWMSHPETSVRTPARRAFEEFRQLFARRFERQYPDGLTVPKPRTRLTHVYRAASGSFQHRFGSRLADMPDISRLSQPLGKIAAIAEACMDDLDAYSRYLGRNPEGRGTIEAHALLPEELAGLVPSGELEELRDWAEAEIAQRGGLVPAETLLEKLEGKAPERMSRRALTTVADALARLSIGMAPDPRYAFRAPRKGEPVVLFRLPEGVTRVEEASSAYQNVLLTLHLGALVAHADGTFHESERRRLEAQIAAVDLSSAERTRLQANLDWLIAVPPTLGQLRKRFEMVTEDQKHAVGQLAIAVAGVDGAVDPAEIKVIQKLYKAMELPEDGVYSDLHAMTGAAPAAEPVTIRPAARARGHMLPPPPNSELPTHTGDAVNLDLHKVSAIMADTAKVSRVLESVFADPEAETDEPAEAEAVDIDEPSFLIGLNVEHRKFVLEIATRSSWTFEEIERLAGQFGLMADGALEIVNEWAFEVHGAALLEEDEALEVNAEIMSMLNGQERREGYGAAQN